MDSKERSALYFAIGYLESTAKGMDYTKPDIAKYAAELLKLIQERLAEEETNN